MVWRLDYGWGWKSSRDLMKDDKRRERERISVCDYNREKTDLRGFVLLKITMTTNAN